MQNYQPMQNYSPYQPMMQTYPDRFSQMQNYQQSISQPAPQVNQGLLWVSGEVGAKSYLVAPNSTVLLMDSDSSRFYLKSADGAGMPSLRIFEYTEVSQNAPQALNSHEINLDGKYVTREEYEGLKRQYEDIMEKLNSIQNTDKPVRKTKGATDNE